MEPASGTLDPYTFLQRIYTSVVKIRPALKKFIIFTS